MAYGRAAITGTTLESRINRFSTVKGHLPLWGSKASKLRPFALETILQIEVAPRRDSLGTEQPLLWWAQ